MGYCFTIFLLTSSLFANTLKVDINPRIPEIGSSYSVIFTVALEGDNNPVIHFDYEGAKKVSEQPSIGTSVRTRFVNGKLFTKKEVTHSYELVSAQAGYALLKNIKANVGGKVIIHPNIRIKVARGSMRPREFFAEAEVSKENIFVGEGITVKYYIYSRGSVRDYELKSYPKLRKFLKRFIDHRERPQNVEIGGEIFRRDLLYAARVFAEKPGKYRIDPIGLRVKYARNVSNSPFMALPFQRLQAREIQSKVIDIKVKPLPPAPSSLSFTGLVGEHTFKLIPGKDRYLVNEAIEVQLEVTGGGALEAYDGPEIYSHSDLEEFETSSDLRILNTDEASKAYGYTYLARAALEIREEAIALTYFDPDEEIYKSIDLAIPGIYVLGSNTTGQVASLSNAPLFTSQLSEEEKSSSSEIVGPVFKEGLFEKVSVMRYLNGFLGLFASVLLLSFFIRRNTKSTDILHAERIIQSLRRGEANYSDIFQLFYLVRGASKEPLEFFIKSQKFSKQAQIYLLDLVSAAENMSYMGGEGIFKFKYSSEPFRELLERMTRLKA